MRRLTMACLLALPAVAAAQAPGRSIHKDKVSGAEVEFVDHPWRPDVFAAFESGETGPGGKRPWAFARLTTSWYLSIGGTVLLPGRYVLVLTPKQGDLPMIVRARAGAGAGALA